MSESGFDRWGVNDAQPKPAKESKPKPTEPDLPNLIIEEDPEGRISLIAQEPGEPEMTPDNGSLFDAIAGAYPKDKK